MASLVLLLQPIAFPTAGTIVLDPFGSLHTVVLCDSFAALLTFYSATPVEFAVAAGHSLSPAFLHSQTTLSTQPLAATLLPFAQILALPQALTALCSRQAQSAVLQAVVGGILQVHQLFARDRAEGLSDRATAGCAVACATQQVHLHGSVIFLL